MSPYPTCMLEFAARFSASSARADLLLSLLDFRSALRAAGIVEAFQWIDGSFVEDIENIRGRPPGDIDVVTFGRIPDSADQVAFRAWTVTHQALFDPRVTKRLFQCDAYFVDIGKSPQRVVDDTRYWYGLFSHQRETFLWKGMIQIPLNSNDEEAREMLQEVLSGRRGDDNA